MLIDLSHWFVALMIAISVHVAGIMWFEPARTVPPGQQELHSDTIVVRLGTGSGQESALASLLNEPEEGGLIEPAEAARDKNRGGSRFDSR